MHHVVVGHVAVAEHRQVDALLDDDPIQLALTKNRNPLRVERAGQLSRVAPILDVGNLRRREGNDFIGGIIAEEDVEVVEITPRRAENDDTLCHGSTSWSGNEELVCDPTLPHPSQ